MLFPWRRRPIIRFTSPNLLGFTHCIRTNRLGFWIFKIQMLNEIEVLGAGRCQVIVILRPIFIKLIQVLSFQNLLLQKWQASRCYKRTRAFIPIFFYRVEGGGGVKGITCFQWEGVRTYALDLRLKCLKCRNRFTFLEQFYILEHVILFWPH